MWMSNYYGNVLDWFCMSKEYKESSWNKSLTSSSVIWVHEIGGRNIVIIFWLFF